MQPFTWRGIRKLSLLRYKINPQNITHYHIWLTKPSISCFPVGFRPLAVGWAQVQWPFTVPQTSVFAGHWCPTESRRCFHLDQWQALLLQRWQLLACEWDAESGQRIPTEQEGALDEMLEVHHQRALETNSGLLLTLPVHWQPRTSTANDKRACFETTVGNTYYIHWIWSQKSYKSRLVFARPRLKSATITQAFVWAQRNSKQLVFLWHMCLIIV